MGWNTTVPIPSDIAFVKPLVRDMRGVDRTNEDFAAFADGQSAESKAACYEAIRRFHEMPADSAAAKWMDTSNEQAASRVFTLVLFLDYLIRSKRVPNELASIKLLQWDNREFDDAGNEW